MSMMTTMARMPIMAMRPAGSTSMMPMESCRMPGIAAVMMGQPTAVSAPSLSSVRLAAWEPSANYHRRQWCHLYCLSLVSILALGQRTVSAIDGLFGSELQFLKLTNGLNLVTGKILVLWP